MQNIGYHKGILPTIKDKLNVLLTIYIRHARLYTEWPIQPLLHSQGRCMNLANLGPLQRAAVVKIMFWDFTAVAKKTKQDLHALGQMVDDEYIAKGIEALRRYHIIACLDPHNPHAVSASLDPFWHSQILFTTDYFKFCEETLGTYMHHIPVDPEKIEEARAIRPQYEYTCNLHKEIFGEEDVVFYQKGVADVLLVCCHYPGNELSLMSETKYPYQAALGLSSEGATFYGK